MHLIIQLSLSPTHSPALVVSHEHSGRLLPLGRRFLALLLLLLPRRRLCLPALVL